MLLISRIFLLFLLCVAILPARLYAATTDLELAIELFPNQDGISGRMLFTLTNLGPDDVSSSRNLVIAGGTTAQSQTRPGFLEVDIIQDESIEQTCTVSRLFVSNTGIGRNMFYFVQIPSLAAQQSTVCHALYTLNYPRGFRESSWGAAPYSQDIDQNLDNNLQSVLFGPVPQTVSTFSTPILILMMLSIIVLGYLQRKIFRR